MRKCRPCSLPKTGLPKGKTDCALESGPLSLDFHHSGMFLVKPAVLSTKDIEKENKFSKYIQIIITSASVRGLSVHSMPSTFDHGTVLLRAYRNWGL